VGALAARLAELRNNEQEKDNGGLQSSLRLAEKRKGPAKKFAGPFILRLVALKATARFCYRGQPEMAVLLTSALIAGAVDCVQGAPEG